MKRVPKARTCYICGRPTLLPGFDNHVVQCKALFEKREAQKPPRERRACPTDPMLHEGMGRYGTSDEFLERANSAAQKAWEGTLAPCANCGRTFLPEKLSIHQRSCTSANPAKRVARPSEVEAMPSSFPSSTFDSRGRVEGSSSRPSLGMGGSVTARISAQSSGAFRADKSFSKENGPMNDFPTYGMLQKCANCGRNFNEVSYAKHVKICKKVFCQKRKVFDSAKARAKNTELADFQAVTRRGASLSSTSRAPQSTARLSATTTGNQRAYPPGSSSFRAGERGSNAGGSMSRWKAQSLEFRNAIRMAKQVSKAQMQSKATGIPLHQILDRNPQYTAYADAMASEQQYGYVQCPTCGRSFNEQAGARHIPKCQFISKPKRLYKGSGLPSYSLSSAAPQAFSSSARSTLGASRAPSNGHSSYSPRTERLGAGYAVAERSMGGPPSSPACGVDQPVRRVLGPDSSRTAVVRGSGIPSSTFSGSAGVAAARSTLASGAGRFSMDSRSPRSAGTATVRQAGISSAVNGRPGGQVYNSGARVSQSSTVAPSSQPRPGSAGLQRRLW